MYYTTHTYSDIGRPYYEIDLIEAEGEAEAIFLDNCTSNGYADKYFTAIDDVTNDDIELDITDYIGEKPYRLFESVLELTDQEDELSRTKIESFYIACLKAKR